MYGQNGVVPLVERYTPATACVTVAYCSSTTLKLSHSTCPYFSGLRKATLELDQFVCFSGSSNSTALPSMKTSLTQHGSPSRICTITWCHAPVVK